MKRKILKAFAGLASLTLLLSACDFMPGAGGKKSSSEGFVEERNTNGTNMRTGHGKPPADFGEVGDTYLDLDTFNLYVKDEAGWALQGSIKGQDGKDGRDGVDGQDGKDGQDGQDGRDGVDGQDGRDGVDGRDGQDGRDGRDGQDGQDGEDAETNEMGLMFFALNENEYAVGVGTAQFFEGQIEIPNEFNGKPITAVSPSGFKESSLTSVVLPESIRTIGEHAFEGCANLRTVTVSSNLDTIQEKAFANCKRLQTISLNNVTYIGDWAFGGCISLQSITLSGNLYNIGQGAFYDCTNLSSVTYLTNKENWVSINAGQYWYVGTNISIINCNDGSFNINLYNEEVLASLDNCYHILGGFDDDNWAPNNDNKMNAASIKQVYDMDRNLGSLLSEKNVDHLYTKQIQVGRYPLDWTSKTLYKNKVREVSGEYTFRVSQSVYNVEGHVYNEQKYIPDAGQFSNRNRAEALTNNIFIPAYQSDMDENGFNWNNSSVFNVQPGSYIFVMAEYKNSNYWSSEANYGFGLIVVTGGDMIVNDPFEEEDPNAEPKTYSGIYLNEDGTEFATSSANSLAELAAYNKHIPEKAAVESTQYGFLEWELVSNIDNVVTFKPIFEACTRGLIFKDDAVDQYVGLTKDVEIPSMWNGQRITKIANRAFQSTDVESVSIPDSIVTIENQAFAGCKKLTSIVIPDSVTRLDSSVFNNCSALESVTLSNNISRISDSLFFGCTALKTVEIPHKVTSIDYNAFRECRALESIVIPNAVTYIGGWSFYDCESLTSIVIPDSVTVIGERAFYYCIKLASVELGSSLTDINYCAFSCCYALESITLPNSLTYAGDNVFEACNNLVVYMSLEYKPKAYEQNWNGSATVIYGYIETVKVGNYSYALSQREDNKYAKLVSFDTDVVTDFQVPASVDGYQVTDINMNLFKNNTTIKSIVLPNTITDLSRDTFNGCTNLESIDLSATSIETIGSNMFGNCTSLVSVVLPDTLETIEYRAFYNCSSLKSIVLPSGVETIGSEAFCGCATLESVVLPESLTVIENNTFAYCYDLESVTLPSALETIKGSAFRYCSSLTSIEIPNSVTRIESSAFDSCSNLTTVKMPDSIEYIGSGVFGGTKIQYNEYENGWYLGNDTNPYLVLMGFKNGDWQYRLETIHEDCVVIYGDWGNIRFKETDGIDTAVIPDNVAYIGYGAFTDTYFEQIVIGSSVKFIDSYAFRYSYGLETIFYHGTKAEWNQIQIGGENNYLFSATRYYYSETQPTEEGNFWHYVGGVPTIW